MLRRNAGCRVRSPLGPRKGVAPLLRARRPVPCRVSLSCVRFEAGLERWLSSPQSERSAGRRPLPSGKFAADGMASQWTPASRTPARGLTRGSRTNPRTEKQSTNINPNFERSGKHPGSGLKNSSPVVNCLCNQPNKQLEKIGHQCLQCARPSGRRAWRRSHRHKSDLVASPRGEQLSAGVR